MLRFYRAAVYVVSSQSCPTADMAVSWCAGYLGESHFCCAAAFTVPSSWKFLPVYVYRLQLTLQCPAPTYKVSLFAPAFHSVLLRPVIEPTWQSESYTHPKNGDAHRCGRQRVDSVVCILHEKKCLFMDPEIHTPRSIYIYIYRHSSIRGECTWITYYQCPSVYRKCVLFL